MKKHRYRLFTLTILTGIATAIIHVFNKIISATAVLKEMLPISEKNYYHWRFGRIYYTKQGSGSPILLIHDLTPGSSGYEWNSIIKHLCMEHTVYTLDLPGCGRSDKPRLTYTNFFYVQMLCDFAENVIKEKTDVISSGFSGSFTLMACQNKKDLFGKLMLINPPSLAFLKKFPNRKSKLLKLLMELPIFGTLLYHISTSQESLRNLLMEQYFYNPFHVTRDLVDAYYEGSHRNSSNAKYLYASILSYYTNFDISYGIKSITNDIFILTGGKEYKESNTAEEYCMLNPTIKTFSLSKTKQLPHIENAEAVMEQIGIYF